MKRHETSSPLKTQDVRPRAGVASVSPRQWASSLRELDPETAKRRAQMEIVSEQIRSWASVFGDLLPSLLSKSWPYSAPGSDILRVTLTGPQPAGSRQLDLRHAPVRIGRSEGCHVQLHGPTVSSEHARIGFDRGAIWITDLKSTNGTRRNGAPIEAGVKVLVQPGDKIEIGPYALTGFEVVRGDDAGAPLTVKASAPRPVLGQPFRALSHAADRWVRVEWAGKAAYICIPAVWIRACWQRVTEIRTQEHWEPDAIEEGVAQFLLLQLAIAAGDELRAPVRLTGWMTAAEAEAAAPKGTEWLGVDVLVGHASSELTTAVLMPMPAEIPLPQPPLDDLHFPASVCVGLIRLKAGDWKQVEPGDALVPDHWFPTSWPSPEIRDADLGKAYVRVGRGWNACRLRVEGGALRLSIETLWGPAPGGDSLVSDKENVQGVQETVPVHELELQVAVELERLTFTVGEMQKWRQGECITLQRTPEDPVRLVVETGAHRRVLAEGRVVLVGGKLGIEIVRILTQFQDAIK